MQHSLPDETPGQYVFRMLDAGITREQAEQHLVDAGHDRRFAQELVAEVAILRNERRRSTGLLLILFGAIVCFLSFILTITGVFTGDSFHYVLFGLTSVGVTIVFVGFTKVF